MDNPAGPNATIKSNARWARIANAIVQKTGNVSQANKAATNYTKPQPSKADKMTKGSM